MTLPITIDLDQLFTGAEWDQTVGQIFREELAKEIRKYVQKEVKESKDLKRALDALKADAVRKIIDAVGKP